jgi:hypothetical protein
MGGDEQKIRHIGESIAIVQPDEPETDPFLLKPIVRN